MSIDDFTPDPDVRELTRVADLAKNALGPVATRMLRALPEPMLREIGSLQAQGWLLGVEVLADQHQQATVCLVTVSPAGERRVLSTIAEGSAPGAH